MNVIEIKNLRKEYPSFQLSDVSFSVEEGKITGFIGRNGAGKTTTIQSMLGIIHPNGGEVHFFEKPYQEHELEIKQEIGYVSGGFSFYLNKKLKTITSVTKRFYSNWEEETYQNCLTQFHLDENKTPSQLSEGMKVKYSLALALSHRARLLILDEPTSGLDPVSREELLDIFLDLQEKGTTIFFSTHITSDLEKCVDNIVYIQKGKIAATGKQKEFLAQYRSVELTKEQYEAYLAVDEKYLIGCKRSKDGYSAIVKAENVNALKSGIEQQEAVGKSVEDDAQKELHQEIQIEPADLETIMVHMEKEA